MTATPVAPSRVVELSRSTVDCAHCGDLAIWRVIGAGKVENRSRGRCLSDVADDTPTDGFQPLVLRRIFPKGSAA